MEMVNPPSNEAVFFGIPTAQNNCAGWLPASGCELTECLCQLDEDGRSRVWISSPSNDPCISVVADKNNFVLVCAVDDSNRIPDGAVRVVHDVGHGQPSA